jgi:hypothetical protein
MTFIAALMSFAVTIVIAVLLNSFGPIFGHQTHVVATGTAFFCGIATFRLFRPGQVQP